MWQSPTGRYWALVSLVIPFGFMTGLSIGIPFLLLGLLLIVLAPMRYRPTIFWPALIGYFAFVAGYVLTVPLSCSSSLSTDGAPTTTTCSNLVGIDYSGTGIYNPSLTGALLAGLGAAAIAGLLTLLLIRRAQSATASRESQPLGK